MTPFCLDRLKDRRKITSKIRAVARQMKPGALRQARVYICNRPGGWNVRDFTAARTATAYIGLMTRGAWETGAQR
jgi:hypothetical protein